MTMQQFSDDAVEGIKVVLGAFAHGMEAGSDMLDWREQCAIRKVAHALGLNPDDFVHRKSYQQYSVGRGYSEVAPWPDPTAPLTDTPPLSDEDV